MNYTITPGIRLIKNISFPDTKIKFTNKPDELKLFNANINLQKVEGGNIINNDISLMFANDKVLSEFKTNLVGVETSIGLFFNCRSLGKINASCDTLQNTCDVKDFYDEENGTGMFQNCTSLTEAELGYCSRLINGCKMFHNCSSLPSFSAKMDNLVYGGGMFRMCGDLTSVDLGSLEQLVYANSMFSDTSISKFIGQTHNLLNASFMFNNCKSMVECRIILNNNTKTTGMFNGCTGLRNLFIQNLACDLDINECPLTLNSITYIADNAKEIQKTIHISDYTKSLSGFGTVKNKFEKKGWTVL